MGPNVMSIWLWRQHNRIARELEAMNPCWDDDRIFSEAREITIAFMNQIVYYELMVVVLGKISSVYYYGKYNIVNYKYCKKYLTAFGMKM